MPRRHLSPSVKAKNAPSPAKTPNSCMLRCCPRKEKGAYPARHGVKLAIQAEYHCGENLSRATLATVAVQFTILGSGSGGNCAYLECGETRLLIDAGFSGRQIRQRLAMIGRAPEGLSGI